jgi:hypothetical protein
VFSRRGYALAALVLIVACPLLAADEIKVSVANVEDQRFSDDRFGGLTVELQLTGTGAADVKAVRVNVKSAKDDGGTILNKPGKEDKARDFEEFSVDRHPGPEIRLSNPRRDASSIDVAGDVELFVPARDPSTKQKIDRFLSQPDKPISNPSLKSAKVEITPLSPKEYKARQAKDRPTKEQIAAEGKKHGASEKEIQEALALMDALSSLGGEEPSENSILFETKDPDGRIISVEVVKADGSELHSQGRSSNGGRELKMVKIELAEKPPADSALLVTLRTSKSVFTVPLSLKEVALP